MKQLLILIISFLFANNIYALEDTHFTGKLKCKGQPGMAIYDDLKTQHIGSNKTLIITIDKNLELQGLNSIGEGPFKLAYSIIDKYFHKYVFYGELGWGPGGEINILMQEYEDETLIGLIMTKGEITNSDDRRLKMRNTFWRCNIAFGE